jgi:ubiquinone/menaquinone biosynthesis C-methylase UbiE
MYFLTDKPIFKNIIQKGKYAAERDIWQARLEFERGMDYYRRRVEAIGFTGHARVLDAACGYGQWTVVLSEQNQWVDGIDCNPGGLEIARDASQSAWRENTAFCQGDLQALPYGDACFDVVFCYGALMLTQEDLTLAELARVLKPGGKIYICSDGPQWPLFRMIHYGLKQRDVRSVTSGCTITLRTIMSILMRKFSPKRTFLRKRDIQRLFRMNGIQMDFYGPDGTFGNRANQFETPFGKTWMGLPVDFEVLGTRDERPD